MATVLVLGGGFGGLAAATSLRDQLRPDDEVILVAREDRFAMGFAKLWDLAGRRPLADGTRSLQQLDARGIRFVHDEVTSIDPSRMRAATTSTTLPADAIVVALGAGPDPGHRAMLDTADGAHDLYDPTQLPAMRDALTTLTEGRVVVSILGGPFKCPPAPYEAALIVDELLRSRDLRNDVEVVVTTPQPMSLPTAGVDASRFIADHLGDHDVELRSGVRVTAIDGATRTLQLAPAPAADDDSEAPEQLDYDLLLGVPADHPPAVLAGSELAAGSGWIEPDPGTLTTGFDRVYAVGDCTRIPTADALLPHAGVFAAAQGRVAAHNAVVDLYGGEHTRFDGHGACFLELPGEQVAFVEGDFYADPPDVALSPPDHDRYVQKQAYERNQLEAWFAPR